MRPILACFLLATALLSGCADEAPPAPVDETDAQPVAPMEPELVMGTDTFGWDVGAGIPTTGIDTQVGSSNAMTIDVPEGAKRLTIIATWTCGPTPCDLHYYLDVADTTGTPAPNLVRDGEHTMGASPLTLTVEDPAPGEWWASVHSDAANAMVDGTFAYELQLS